MSSPGSSVRRSSRSRRQVTSVYDDAMAQREARNSLESEKSKRKRSRSDDEDHSDDEEPMEEDEEEVEMEVEEDSDDSDDEEVEAEPPKRKRQRSTSRKIQVPANEEKQVAKKPKSKGRAVPTRSTRGRKAIQSALSSLAKKVLDASETPANSLVAALLESHKTTGEKGAKLHGDETVYSGQLAKTARRIVNGHQQDPNKAEVELINLIFRSVGGSVENMIDPEDFDLENMSKNDWDEPVMAVVDTMGETPLEATLLCADPLGAQHEATNGTKSTIGAVEYRKIYEEFWYQLGVVALAGTGAASAKTDRSDDDSDVEEEDKGIGSERFQVEQLRTILQRVLELCGILTPDIRAAAMIAVYQIGIAMLERTVAIKVKLETAERQLKVARKSKMNKKAGALKTQVDTWKRSKAELEEMVKGTVMNVFLKRYRDINKYIRADSLKILSRFSLIRPDIFLNSSYLKYICWMLSDEEAIVRQTAVACLLAPFQERGGGEGGSPAIDTSSMTSLIERFATRLADCTSDSDNGVQEVAMELLLKSAQHSLLDNVSDEVFEQINLRAIAPTATAQFRRSALFFVLDQMGSFDSIDSKMSESHDVARIQELASWIVNKIADSEFTAEEDVKYESADHIVPSLRSEPNHKRLICNWAALLKALEIDKKTSNNKEKRLDAIQKRVILRMFIHSAELEALEFADDTMLSACQGDTSMAVKKASSGRVTKKNKKENANHEELTLALLRALPRLFVAFKSEPAALESLTRLPRFFLPSVFNLSSRKRDFQELSSRLSDVFLESTDASVLTNCCLALTAMAKSAHARSDDALLILKTTVRKVRGRLFQLYDVKAALTNTGEDEVSEDLSMVETATSISLCLLRLRVVSKQWYIAELLFDDLSQEAQDKEIENLLSMVAEDCAVELDARQVVHGDEEQQITIPKIWSTADRDLHAIVASSVEEVLNFLLMTIAWRLKLELKLEEKNESKVGDDPKDHVVVRVRDHLVKLLMLCTEQFIDPKLSDEFSEEHLVFSERAQSCALRTAGDLRTLLPREWSKANSSFLAACALTEDDHLRGGHARFLRSRGSELKANEEIEEENVDGVQRVLLPVCHALAGNWQSGHRREAGRCLSHIVGSGQEASSLVVALSRVLKKIDPIRCLEAHMACLRQEFEHWIDSTPEEPESDRPTEDELAACEELDKAHASMLDDIEQKAARLSQSLGVGKLSSQLSPKILSFVQEGVRYAFSTYHKEYNEHLPLGARLPFLRIVAKYLTWTRRDKRSTDELRADFNQHETDLRNHQDFIHVLREDKETLDMFRKTGNLGVFLVEDEEEDENDEEEEEDDDDEDKVAPKKATGPFRPPRTSLGSSVSSIRSKVSAQTSLSPLPEEGDDSGDGEDQVDRRGTLTSTTSLSISTLGRTQEPVEEGDEESEIS